MYCSTCGAAVPAGRTACRECGTRVARTDRELRGARDLAAAPAAADAVRWAEPQIGSCPRCAYQGEGLPYFSRSAHVAALVGATMLTAGAMGAGGLVYYVVRREHRICPRCGHGWGKFGEYGRVGSGATAPRAPRRPDAIRPDREGVKTVFSWIFFALAALMLIPLVAGGEAAAIVFGALFAGGGYLLRRAAVSDREARRAALISSLQLPVLKLAAEHGGRLTVTLVASELGWTLARAEKILDSLEDGVRIASEVTDEGVILYEFREIMNAPRAAKGLRQARADEDLWIEPPREA